MAYFWLPTNVPTSTIFSGIIDYHSNGMQPRTLLNLMVLYVVQVSLSGSGVMFGESVSIVIYVLVRY